MSNKTSSSSSSTAAQTHVDEKSLLKFYQKKYEEFLMKEDKFKEKVDKHLKDLAADRRELEEENLRRGDKIADLQKALVELQLSVFEERERYLRVSTENEELKRNEKQLHANIRDLLALTKQQDLRDKIIYMLKNPRVEIGYHEGFSKESDIFKESSSAKKLQEEVDHLNRQLDEVLRVSKTKADVLLEDCRQTLTKSKEQILQDEIEIKELRKRVQRLEDETRDKRCTSVSDSIPVASQTVKSSADEVVQAKICSHLRDVHLSLILLTKVVSKVIGILNAMQATKLYQRTAEIPSAPSGLEHLVEENTILQLETCLRQCTRLAFDISDRQKSLRKYISDNQRRIQNINSIKSELKVLEDLMKEMSITTADNDLLNVGLRRSNFFDALRDSSTDISSDDREHLVNNFKKIVSNSETLKKTVSKASGFVEDVLKKFSAKTDNPASSQANPSVSSPLLHSHRNDFGERLAAKSDTEVMLQQAKHKSRDLENLLGIYRRTAKDAENLGLSAESKVLSEKIKATERKLQDEAVQTSAEVNREPKIPAVRSHSEDVLRSINKTLSKVDLIKEDRYLKDEEVCRKLADNVNALKEQFKQLTQEISVKSVQEQFSEYSSLTLSKLEELAKQSRNSVIAAEAQIAAHRSNAKHLSEKLSDTEELLRESINECLSLKQKLKQVQDQLDMEKYSVLFKLKEKLKECGTSTQVDDLLDEMTCDVPVQTSKSKTDRFVCMYCKQGSEHKLCEEKIRDLTAEVRKYKTQMKLREREIHEEKLSLKTSQSAAEITVSNLTEKNHFLNEQIEDLKKKNASLLEQLTVLKSRIKNMERFRRLEIEGFQTDVKQLKNKIRDLEKQMMKAVVIFENNKKDMELLKTVHETAQRSKQAASAIRRLKAKLYELENDIKSL